MNKSTCCYILSIHVLHNDLNICYKLYLHDNINICINIAPFPKRKWQNEYELLVGNAQFADILASAPPPPPRGIFPITYGSSGYIGHMATYNYMFFRDNEHAITVIFYQKRPVICDFDHSYSSV